MSTRIDRMVDMLRADSARLDDIRRARMERDLVAAWKHRGALGTWGRRPASGSRRWQWAASALLSGVMGGMVAVYVTQYGAPAQSESVVASPVDAAYFEVRIGDAATQTGTLKQGQTLASGEHGQVRVHMGATRIDMARDSQLRFDRISDSELRVVLTAGRIQVAFHPVRRGEQHLSIETASATVMVVGTEFSVDVDGDGTDVSVTEGVVRVRARHGDEHTVMAGDSVHVPAHAPLRAPSASVVVPPTEAEFNADLDFGASPEAIDVGRLVAPSVRAVAPRSAASETAVSVASSTPSRRATDAAVVNGGDESLAPLTAERRLELARGLLRQGRHDQARALLRVLTEAGQPVSHQVEAWTLTAESYTAQGYVPRAADSYSRAADVGRGSQAGHNAVFAWARLLERHTRDQQAAVLIYERYVREAPGGALALQATDALCRLGQVLHCQ